MNLKSFLTVILTASLMFFFQSPVFGAYKVSPQGESFIKRNEGLSLKAYPDAGGWSIGYGHHSKSVRPGQVISKAQAERYFAEDMVIINQTINKLLAGKPHKFSQKFIDGLGDLLFNCGENSVRRSKFYARLGRCRNDKDLKYVCAAVRSHAVRAAGHVERRKKTLAMMIS